MFLEDTHDYHKDISSFSWHDDGSFDALTCLQRYMFFLTFMLTKKKALREPRLTEGFSNYIFSKEIIERDSPALRGDHWLW